MLYREVIAVCSEIHKHTVWAERRILEHKTWWYVKLPLGFKWSVKIRHNFTYMMVTSSSANFANYRSI
jgi:hypothetical protein